MQITVIRSKRRTISIQVNSDLSVTVRAPEKIKQKDIERILEEKEAWIKKHIERIASKKEQYDAMGMKSLSDEELMELADKAVAYIPERVKYFAEIIGVDYGRVTVRNQKTRWGSCSSKGNLNFNCLLMLTPVEIIDYVVVHELCHRKEMNHSKAFWNEVEKVFPEYRSAERWLKKEGSFVMKRGRGE